MSLQFIAGGSGSGKTRYLYEKVIKESEEHPDIQYLFIVPEQYTMQTQKELVRLHPRHGLLNIDVLSFKRLAYRVFEHSRNLLRIYIRQRIHQIIQKFHIRGI